MSTKGLTTEEQQRWKAFGFWLRDERKKRHLTRREVCEPEGVQWMHPVQLARIEAGASRTSREKIERLAKEIGCDLTEALDRAGYAPLHETTIEARIYRKLQELTPERQADVERMIDVWMKDRHYVVMMHDQLSA